MVVKIRKSYAPSAGTNPKARLPTLKDFSDDDKIVELKQELFQKDKEIKRLKK